MHVIIVNYAYAADLTGPDELIERYFSLVTWADGLALAGAQVTVLQAFAADAQRQRGSVSYRFINDGLGPHPRAWQIPRRLHQAAAQAQPAVVHVNGLLFPAQTWALRRRLPPACVLLAQHHAERPWPGVRGMAQRWGLAAADGFMFAARALAQPWLAQGVIATRQPLFEIMEGAPTFCVGARPEARALTGLTGDPIFLWAGNLDANKDPLTVLAGFEMALPAMPDARLYMTYRFADLLPQVQNRIAQSATLTRAVTLLGQFSHAEMERYFNSADYFVQGSHHESSGFALLDALACGVVPIVPDIPTFRIMTDQGKIGALWPAGDAAALAGALRATVARPWAEQGQAARQFFDAHLSVAAIGRQALDIYQSVRRRRSGARPDARA